MYTGKILIVEDDADLVAAYTDLLVYSGHTVSSVAKAADAIQLVSRLKPSVVILDLNLPGDSGATVLKFIRSYPPLKNTKVIIASGQVDILKKANYITLQADLILSKPVDIERLLEAIDQFMTPV